MGNEAAPKRHDRSCLRCSPDRWRRATPSAASTAVLGRWAARRERDRLRVVDNGRRKAPRRDNGRQDGRVVDHADRGDFCRAAVTEKPEAPRKPFRFQIPQPPRGGQRSVILEGIHMSYPSAQGERKVYSGLDLTIERGERTVLVGPNGAGKSTLLKILAGVLEFQQGKRIEGPNAKIGYFSQHRAATLDANKSVLDEVRASNGELSENDARGILGSFLFRKDDIFKKTAVLSGGEKTRLNLVKFLVDPPNLLLMDEPTTHLDIHTVESLILALGAYEGTLVFISHDVHFIRKLATKVLHVKDGKVTPHLGGYDEFLERVGALGNEREALTT